jgi:hypothetical protein
VVSQSLKGISAGPGKVFAVGHGPHVSDGGNPVHPEKLEKNPERMRRMPDGVKLCVHWPPAFPKMPQKILQRHLVHSFYKMHIIS